MSYLPVFNFQNGTSNRSDNTLRYLCAKLIRVFVQWSLKRTKIDIRHHRVPVNVEAVVKKICFFCELPSSHNKLGKFFLFYLRVTYQSIFFYSVLEPLSEVNSLASILKNTRTILNS